MLFSDDDNQIEPVSVVEDLDPEPEQMGQGWWRSSGKRELVLGLLLLFGVLGWVSYSWLNDDSNSNHYDQAERAVFDRRWDDAFSNYAAVKGYKDADARAAAVAKQIKTRDSQYEVAKAHQQSGPAALALQAARAVQTIEPGYKDVDKLSAQAEDQVYTDALSGTIVMRTEAYPPGLYYRGPAGWKYLRDSDQWSSVLSIPLSAASAKHVVYDVPGPGWTAPAPTSTPTSSPYAYQLTEGLSDKAGRRLIMATFPGSAGEPGFVSLQFDPVSSNFYICGDDGVWGLRYSPTTSEPVTAKGLFNNVSLSYEKLGEQTTGQVGREVRGSVTHRVATVVMPGTDGIVADFGHNGNKLLLAAHGPHLNNIASTQLYLTEADGSDQRVVFSTTGSLVSALLSPDDQYALVISSQPLESPAGQALVVATLLTLDGAAPPIMLQKISID